MRTLVLLFAAFFPLCAAARPPVEESGRCGYRTVDDGTVFTLSVDRSFDSSVAFKLCARVKPDENFLLVTVVPQERGTVEEWELILDLAAYERILGLYEDALNYNVKDDAMGFDGSIWCLETRRGFTYSKACFWTPGHETEKRGLAGLEKLGKELWELAGKKQKLSGLY